MAKTSHRVVEDIPEDPQGLSGIDSLVGEPFEPFEPFEAGQVAAYQVDDLTGAPVGSVEDTALVPYEPESGSTSLSVGSYTSEPEFGTEDIQLSRLRLLQHLSAEVVEQTGKAGQWAVSGHDPVDEVVIIPMLYSKQREYRENDENRTLMCSSQNGLVGKGDPGGLCERCPFAKWTANPRSDKNDPPKCTPIHSYLAYSPTHGEIIQLNLSKTASGAAKMLNGFIAMKNLGNFAVKLRSQAQKSNRGSYYTPVLGTTPVSANDISNAKAAFALE